MVHASQYPCLILTADYRPQSVFPLSTISWKDSFRLQFLNKINVIDWYDKEIHSATKSFKIPALAAIKKFSYHQKDKTIRFTRGNIFLRDHYTCAYCHEIFDSDDLTIDHIIPTSKGGQNNWYNVTTACYDCNTKKGNSVVGWSPLHEPFKPDQKSLLTKRKTQKILHPSWEPYLL